MLHLPFAIYQLNLPSGVRVLGNDVGCKDVTIIEVVAI